MGLAVHVTRTTEIRNTQFHSGYLKGWDNLEEDYVLGYDNINKNLQQNVKD
jgi:hypothetical protein